MRVLQSITLFHSAEFAFVELLKTANTHEIHVNNIYIYKERGGREGEKFFTLKEPHYRDQPVNVRQVIRFT